MRSCNALHKELQQVAVELRALQAARSKTQSGVIALLTAFQSTPAARQPSRVMSFPEASREAAVFDSGRDETSVPPPKACGTEADVDESSVPSPKKKDGFPSPKKKDASISLLAADEDDFWRDFQAKLKPKRTVDHVYEGPEAVSRAVSDGGLNKHFMGGSTPTAQPIVTRSVTLPVKMEDQHAAVEGCTGEANESYRKAFSSWSVGRFGTKPAIIECDADEEVGDDAVSISDSGLSDEDRFREAFCFSSEPVKGLANMLFTQTDDQDTAAREAFPQGAVTDNRDDTSDTEFWESVRETFEGEQPEDKIVHKPLQEAETDTPAQPTRQSRNRADEQKGALNDSLAHIAEAVLDSVDLVESMPLQRLQRFARKQARISASCPVQRFTPSSNKTGAQNGQREISPEPVLPVSMSCPLHRISRFRDKSKKSSDAAQEEANEPCDSARGGSKAYTAPRLDPVIEETPEDRLRESAVTTSEPASLRQSEPAREQVAEGFSQQDKASPEAREDGDQVTSPRVESSRLHGGASGYPDQRDRADVGADRNEHASVSVSDARRAPAATTESTDPSDQLADKPAFASWPLAQGYSDDRSSEAYGVPDAAADPGCASLPAGLFRKNRRGAKKA